MTADLTISRDLVRGGSRKSTNLRYNLKFTPIRGIQLTETIPLGTMHTNWAILTSAL